MLAGKIKTRLALLSMTFTHAPYVAGEVISWLTPSLCNKVSKSRETEVTSCAEQSGTQQQLPEEVGTTVCPNCLP